MRRLIAMMVVRPVSVLVFAAAIAPAGAKASEVTRVEVLATENVGTFNGIGFRRWHGIVHGHVDADEDVAGLKSLPGANAEVEYAVAFELMAPVTPQRADAVIVEVENRGRPVVLGMLAGFAPPSAARPVDIRYPAGLGNGYPFRLGVGYARVAWQTGVASDVPATAQGVGLVILRDFGRWLAASHSGTSAGPLPRFGHRVLAGVSQSAWMVNAFVAEGFNRDPATGSGVYQGAWTRDGVGLVLAINKAANGGPQAPYPLADAVPLLPRQLLRRPESDPVMVDIAAYTDFYRLRASIFATASGVPGLHRYAVGAAHAPAGSYPDALVFGTLHCNGGVAVPLNPLNDAAHARALTTALMSAIGVPGMPLASLPRDRGFDLSAPGDAPINLLAGETVRVPRVSAAMMPVGGVPMVEVSLPLGRPVPPAIPPVGTRSITQVCGNFGGWVPFSPDELRRRYGSPGDYRRRAALLLDRQQADGWLLAADKTVELNRIAEAAARAFGGSAGSTDPATEKRPRING